MTPHRWKNSWPGNFCLDCGAPDPLEEATEDCLVDCDCVGGCGKCAYTGVVLDPRWKEKITDCPCAPLDLQQNLAINRLRWFFEEKGIAEEFGMSLGHKDWAESLVASLMADHGVPTPALYPVAVNSIRCEWTRGDWEISAEISLGDRTAFLHALSLKSSEQEERFLTFSELGDTFAKEVGNWLTKWLNPQHSQII